MRWHSSFIGIVATAVATSGILSPPPSYAGDFYKPFRFLKQPFEAAHREKPVTGKDDRIEQLANEIDWLEHHVDKYGSVVAKHPDIWGQSRLMRHRYEYEKEMATQINHFEVRLNGALSRSDQAFLGMALAIQSAATGKSIPGVTTTLTDKSTATPGGDLTLVNNLIPNTGLTPVDGSGKLTAQTIISRSSPFGSSGQTVNGFGFQNTPNLSLEPTTQLDQLSRYLGHLHELRRINEGDDIADSPGYSLNLVRIPVSIIPGKQTQKGYGAEVTVIAEPYLSEDLLPSTMRNLVINDVVDLLAPVLTFLVNDEQLQSDQMETADNLRTIVEESEKIRNELKSLPEQPIRRPYLKNMGVNELRALIPKNSPSIGSSDSPSHLNPNPSNSNQNQIQSQNQAATRIEANNRRADKIVEDFYSKGIQRIKDAGGLQSTNTAIPNSNTRRARLPIPLSQVIEVVGRDALFEIMNEVSERFGSHPANQPTISYVDVRSFLHEELESSYDFLKGESFGGLWQYCTPALANAIRERRLRWIDDQRRQFLDFIGIETPNTTTTPDPTLGSALTRIAGECCKPATDTFPICKTTTARLAWGILVESALLNERLTEDMREAAMAKGCHCVPENCGPFVGPTPSPEACQAFNAYVRCRWPVRVFALDPVEQDQNIADAYARRRELQVAVALAFASGQMNAQSMMRFTRRLEWDMETININKTSVGFSHGNDTFGWRFHPRFQSPPVKGTFATFGETLFGGPSTNSDIRTRQLESGIRECTAIVVMPSFVPYMTFDVRTNWFKLTNPKCTEISMKETMTLSRSIQAMRHSAASCAQCAHLYRDGEVHRLLKRVDQLDRELPLQTMQAQIPYENTSGGFELFNNGITDLAPELIGWYGAPGINPNGSTSLYLVGKGFSVHSTQLIAGGRNLPFTLISRQVMEVEIPAGVQTLQRTQDGEGRLDQVVDIHLATPYGVSGHMLVPVAKASSSTRNIGNGQVAWRNGSKLTLTATITTTAAVGGNPATKSTAISNLFNAVPDVWLIDIPQISPVPASIILKLFVHDANDGTFVGTFATPALNFDASNSTAYLTGNELNTIAIGSSNSISTVAKDYVTWLASNRSFSNGTVSLRVTAALDQGAGRPLVPIDGGFDVDVNATTKP